MQSIEYNKENHPILNQIIWYTSRSSKTDHPLQGISVHVGVRRNEEADIDFQSFFFHKSVNKSKKNIFNNID